MNYNIILERFEGPLDLLHNLIEKEKIDIYDIPISKITDQYINHINSMKELDLEIASEFLIMATTLIEIKSKMLLPKIKKNNSEENLVESDPREELVKRLIEYKKYKEVSLKLKDRETTYKKIYYKAKEEIEYFDDELNLENVDLNKLIGLYENILERCIVFEKDMDLEEIKRDEVTIEESIREIQCILQQKCKVKFEDFFERETTVSVVVTTFLAILELIKQKQIRIKQEGNFSGIFIELKN